MENNSLIRHKHKTYNYKRFSVKWIQTTDL